MCACARVRAMGDASVRRCIGAWHVSWISGHARPPAETRLADAPLPSHSSPARAQLGAWLFHSKYRCWRLTTLGRLGFYVASGLYSSQGLFFISDVVAKTGRAHIMQGA